MDELFIFLLDKQAVRMAITQAKTLNLLLNK
jgi:hypothetical protein